MMQIGDCCACLERYAHDEKIRDAFSFIFLSNKCLFELYSRKSVFGCCNKTGSCNFRFRKYMSRVMRKQTFCICENKDADQLRGNREAD